MYTRMVCKVLRAKNRPHREAINSLLSELRTSPSPGIIFYTANGRKPSEFLSGVISSLHKTVKRMDKKIFVKSQYTLFPTYKPPIWDGLSEVADSGKGFLGL